MTKLLKKALVYIIIIYIAVKGDKKWILKGKIGLYLGRIHTSRDVVFDTDNISRLADGAVEFVKALD